jgi:precorrin-3B methylase
MLISLSQNLVELEVLEKKESIFLMMIFVIYLYLTNDVDELV